MPNTPEGVKIGFIPDPGTEDQFRSALNGRDRWEYRQRAQAEAHEASKARARRSKKSYIQLVEEAQRDIQGRNVADTIALIQTKSNTDMQIFLLAEEYGDGRATVLRSFGGVSADVKEKYQKELLIARSLADAEDGRSGRYGDNPADEVTPDSTEQAEE